MRVTVEPIESWSQNDRIQFFLSESDMLIINERLDEQRTRATTLAPDETLDLLQFLQRFEKDIFERMQGAKPPASEAEKWHQWRKAHGFE